MDSKTIINRVTQQLKQVANDSKTPAGNQETPATVEQKEAINQIFELFRFNYHNQFLKAFPDLDTLIIAKRFWARLLVQYSGPTILHAAEKTVKESSWLPSVHDILENCVQGSNLGLPSAHAAYMEACRAPEPKKSFNWTHPAIYFAGLSTDWFFLANEVEDKAFPVFQRNYELLLKRIAEGENIELPIAKALPEEVRTPMSKEAQKAQLKELLKQL